MPVCKLPLIISEKAWDAFIAYFQAFLFSRPLTIELGTTTMNLLKVFQIAGFFPGKKVLNIETNQESMILPSKVWTQLLKYFAWLFIDWLCMVLGYIIPYLEAKDYNNFTDFYVEFNKIGFALPSQFDSYVNVFLFCIFNGLHFVVAFNLFTKKEVFCDIYNVLSQHEIGPFIKLEKRYTMHLLRMVPMVIGMYCYLVGLILNVKTELSLSIGNKWT